MKKNNLRFTITFTGDSASELLAIGTKDLMNNFIPEKWGLDSKDVESIRFYHPRYIENGIVKQSTYPSEEYNRDTKEE